MNRKDFIRRTGLGDTIANAESTLRSVGSTQAFEDLAVEVWNTAIDWAIDEADDTDIEGDPAKRIEKLKVTP